MSRAPQSPPPPPSSQPAADVKISCQIPRPLKAFDPVSLVVLMADPKTSDIPSNYMSGSKIDSKSIDVVSCKSTQIMKKPSLSTMGYTATGKYDRRPTWVAGNADAIKREFVIVPDTDPKADPSSLLSLPYEASYRIQVVTVRKDPCFDSKLSYFIEQDDAGNLIYVAVDKDYKKTDKGLWKFEFQGSPLYDRPADQLSPKSFLERAAGKYILLGDSMLISSTDGKKYWDFDDKNNIILSDKSQVVDENSKPHAVVAFQKQSSDRKMLTIEDTVTVASALAASQQDCYDEFEAYDSGMTLCKPASGGSPYWASPKADNPLAFECKEGDERLYKQPPQPVSETRTVESSEQVGEDVNSFFSKNKWIMWAFIALAAVVLAAIIYELVNHVRSVASELAAPTPAPAAPLKPLGK